MRINVDEFKERCSCGKEHNIYVKDIIIEAGALNKLPQVIDKDEYSKYKRPCIICDDNTYIAAGEKVKELVPNSLCIKLESKNLHANEKGVEVVLEKLNDNVDILIAVGSGTIHDITRYVAYKKGIVFISVPTAASVDGFVSTVAAMTWNGCKKTFTAVSPICVIADSSIYAKAPYRLTASGISDLLGKYTAIADWKVSSLLTGEYICNKVCELETKALETVCNNITLIRSGDLEATEQLMYALLLSGLAMQMVGNSRPASGAEHHMSHLWEMEIINKSLDAYHGEKVSVGLVISTEVYHKIKEVIDKNEITFRKYSGLEKEFLKECIKDEKVLKELMQENSPDPLLNVDDELVKEKIKDISRIISEIPTPEVIKDLLKEAGCKKTLEDIGLDENILGKSIKLSPYVRNRLTLMRVSKLFS